MALPIEDTELREQALAYVVALYRELAAENGAPSLGTQNQAVDFILADPEWRRAVADWAAAMPAFGEAATAPPRRLPCDRLYECLRDYMAATMGPPMFGAPGHRAP